jgi:GT2 family glycosyltransferase
MPVDGQGPGDTGNVAVNIFAMVTTRHSHAYTNYALSSLIEHTKLEPEDVVILIDNDANYPGLPDDCAGKVQMLVNENPRSFAANLNQTLERARERKATVVFLNNDLIFSRGWYEPLRSDGPFLLSPLSNAEIQYSEGGLDCKLGMDLEDYLGKEHLFRDIARRHRNRTHGYMKVLTFPFFAVKIPYQVYSVVGNLDETFGIGGGEDKDYCIRCYLEGFELSFALNSYILHFQGKSTWRGAETREQTAARDRFYMERFKQKWGDAFFDLMCLNDVSKLPPDLRRAHDEGDFRQLIERLKPHTS